jgi:hypothetical protein
MPVMPANYGGGFGGGFADGWWIILLFLFAGGGFGWGNGFGGFGGNGGFMNADIQRGFDQSAIMTGVSGIQNTLTSGFGDLQTALCGGFAGVNANISNGFAQAEIGENARQMANMQQMFGIQSSLQNCCCENRANIADLKYTVATEACADRAAVTSALQDLTGLINARFNQAEMQRFQDKVDAKNEKIIELQNSLNMANLAASQTVQTQQILAALTTVTPAA